MKTKTRVNISYYIIVVFLMLVSITVNLTSDNLSSNSVDILFTTLTQVVGMFILPVTLYFILIKPKSNLKDFKNDFGFKPFKKGELFKVFLLGLLAIFLNTAFANINYGFLELCGYNYGHSAPSDYVNNLGLFFLDLFMTAFLPAVCEETAHRGLFRISWKEKPVKYILLSALLFSLMHQNIAQSIYTFLTGIMFASAVVFTGNLYASMIMHFMVNAVEVIGSLGVQVNSVGLALKNVVFNLLSMNIITKIVLVLLTILAIYLFIRVLYSFKSREHFHFEKVKRMFLDGSLTIGYEVEERATIMSVVMLVTIILIGLATEGITLYWGLIR